MGITNLHWTDANTARDYPLADNALAVAGNGRRLPTDIIADLSVQYPASCGVLPFVASVTVTPGLVSVTLQAAASDSDTTSFAPIGVFTVAQPVTPGTVYPLQPQVRGAGGWVVFGPGALRENYSGRFTPAAGQLCPRACRLYYAGPVSSLRPLNDAAGLSGIVRLHATPPLEIVGEYREINDILRLVGVIRLVQPPASPNPLATQTNVFQQFAGPCGSRPETGTCPGPGAIQALNAVPPDCNGNITVEIRGLLRLGEILSDASGVVIDALLGLSDVCTAAKLPDAFGNLPGSYPDLCVSGGLAVYESETHTLPPVSEFSEVLHAPSLSLSVLVHLPHLESFDRPGLHGWSAESGIMSLAVDDMPAEASIASEISETVRELEYLTPHDSLSSETGMAYRNIFLWDRRDLGTVGRRCQFALKLLDGISGAAHNGGLVLNYRQSIAVPGSYVWFLIGIDQDAQLFSIQRYNGTSLNLSSAFASLTGLVTGSWYTIEATVVSAGGSNVTITAKLSGPDGFMAEIATTTNQLLPDDGQVGFHANRAATRFSYLLIEEAK